MEILVSLMPHQQTRPYLVEPNQPLSTIIEDICRHVLCLPNVNPSEYCLRLPAPEETLITELNLSRKISPGSKLVLCPSPAVEATKTVENLQEFLQDIESITSLTNNPTTNTSNPTLNSANTSNPNLNAGNTSPNPNTTISPNIPTATTPGNTPGTLPGFVSSASVANSQAKLKRLMFALQKYISETEFSDKFISLEGVSLLTKIISVSMGNSLAYSLTALQNLMERDKGWENFDQSFINKIVEIVASQSVFNVCRPATGIIIKLVSADETSESQIRCYGYKVVRQAMLRNSLITTLIQRLRAADKILQSYSLNLINALFHHVDEQHKDEFLAWLDNGMGREQISHLMQSVSAFDLESHLFEFQRLFIREWNRKKTCLVNITNIHHQAMLNGIWEASKLTADRGRKWRMIGFKTEFPKRELQRVGVLSLENLWFFVKEQPDFYAKMMREQQTKPLENQFPFARASIEITEVLADYWSISTGYTTNTKLQPLSLNFERIHSASMLFFLRLWTTLNASSNDFAKVLGFTRCQIKFVLKNENNMSIYQYMSEVDSATVPQLKERYEKLIEEEDELLTKPPVRQLKEKLYQEAYEFVKQQRISCLINGAWFPDTMSPHEKRSAEGRKGNIRWWRYFRLSPNKRYLHYGDVYEHPVYPNHKVPLNELPEKLDLNQVTEVVAGANHLYSTNTTPSFSRGNFSSTIAAIGTAYKPMMSGTISGSILSSGAMGGGNWTIREGGHLPSSAMQQKREEESLHSFLLMGGPDTVLASLICQNPVQYSEWVDGLSMLLDKSITTADTSEFIQSLTEIGVKFALLDFHAEPFASSCIGMDIQLPDSIPDSNYYFQVEM